MKWRRIDGVNEPNMTALPPDSVPVLVGYIYPTSRTFAWARGRYYKDSICRWFQGDGMSGHWDFTHFMEIEPPSGEET